MPCLPTTINNQPVCLEFIKPRSAQIQGLSGKNSIPDNYGMVFDIKSLGKKNIAYFTMSGMKFPIDMIFVRDNKIQLIEYNAKPCSDKPNKCLIYGGFPVDYVIETSVGNANKWGLRNYQKFTMRFQNTNKK